jgi:hypothetical protein
MEEINMKNTFKIIGFDEFCGDKFFTVAITNQDGDTHTDRFCEITLMKFAKAMERKNAKFEIDEENEELVNELSQLSYMEIAEEEEDGKEIFDVYVHKFIADEDVLEIDIEGEYIKSYKSEKAARNFAAKQRYIILD